ncbi:MULTISPECIES: TetR/AcrR family transcriptional regulator [Paenibacillus]|uniref:TetR/AcrR family transcriptional regulator n=1 Tax=Paenibacillus TaxID=44249 RepID=UPI00048A9F56|nr:TetR/AcrR family transcriptional regulator [Paenibacillus sp. IHBB 10380]
MNGYERRKQKKMEQIFEAAIELFFKHGFQKVNVNEIAQKAKVSPATIYNYFGTKEQLYADSLAHWMDKQLEQYEAILDSGRTFPEKTKEIMLLEARNLNILGEEFPKVPSSELSGLMDMMDRYSEEKIVGFFKRFVALGKQEGYILEDRSEEMLVRYFTMFQNELRRHWESANQERMTWSMDQWMELFFYGAAGREN